MNLSPAIIYGIKVTEKGFDIPLAIALFDPCFLFRKGKQGYQRLSGNFRRALIKPRHFFFKLGCKPKQCGFISEPSDQLHSAGKAFLRPKKRHGHGRLPG
jgi:hypothetical protein